MNPLTYAVVNAAVILLVRRGAIRVELGILTRGQVVALYNYMSQILVELIKLANLTVTMNKGWASWKRVEDVLNLEPAMDESGRATEAAPGIAAAVTFDHATLTYPGGAGPALTDVSFAAMPGHTGSGKSSVAGLIPRFYDVTGGRVLVKGRDVREYAPEALRSMIGMVLQRAVLFKGTIRDNLRWGKPDATEDELLAAAKAAQALDVLEAKGGLDAMLEQGGGNLSGGQRQRLTIARALVRRPEILILDDSASALDMATDARLRQAIAELDYRPTVFIISQRTASIMGADVILVLDEGRLVGKGTHAELLETCDIYREIYESQFRKEDAR